jgi:membrane protein required for colicin V production
MNWLDFVIIGMLAVFVLAAYSSGLIREVITFVAVILGIVFASIFYDNFASKVLTFIHDQEVARGVSFLIFVGALYLLGQILAYIVKKFATLLMLGWADHIGGAFFGLLKGLLIVQILLIVLAAYPSLKFSGAVRGSAIAPYFLDDVSFILKLLPGEFDTRIGQFLNPQTPPPS